MMSLVGLHNKPTELVQDYKALLFFVIGDKTNRDPLFYLHSTSEQNAYVHDEIIHTSYNIYKDDSETSNFLFVIYFSYT
jgi:hypothetical protein